MSKMDTEFLDSHASDRFNDRNDYWAAAGVLLRQNPEGKQETMRTTKKMTTARKMMMRMMKRKPRPTTATRSEPVPLPIQTGALDI